MGYSKLSKSAPKVLQKYSIEYSRSTPVEYSIDFLQPVSSKITYPWGVVNGYSIPAKSENEVQPAAMIFFKTFWRLNLQAEQYLWRKVANGVFFFAGLTCKIIEKKADKWKSLKEWTYFQLTSKFMKFYVQIYGIFSDQMSGNVFCL